LKQITDCLEKGETVKLSSFGSLVRKKSQRLGRNPKTGIEVLISPRRVMVFKPSAIMKQQINGQPPGSGVVAGAETPVVLGGWLKLQRGLRRSGDCEARSVDKVKPRLAKEPPLLHLATFKHRCGADVGVDFVAADRTNANRLTVDIMAMAADDEGLRIRARTKAALAAAKACGTKLGGIRRVIEINLRQRVEHVRSCAGKPAKP
jgi:hypothetical protein